MWAKYIQYSMITQVLVVISRGRERECNHDRLLKGGLAAQNTDNTNLVDRESSDLQHYILQLVN